MAVAKRRHSVVVNIGGVKVGGRNPIVVQSMTNTDTADVAGTVNQTMALARAGSGIGPRDRQYGGCRTGGAEDRRDARQVWRGQKPIVGDFHYNGHLLLKKYPDCAKALAKYRINPGNVNIGKKHDDNFCAMIEVAIENQRPRRESASTGVRLDGALLTRMMDENSKLDDPLMPSK